MIPYIIKALQQQPSVFVNDLGTFTTRYQPAKLLKDRITPPRNVLVFDNTTDHDEMAFTNLVCQERQCLLTQGNDAICKWVDELKSALLNNKSISFEDFGTFSIHENGTISFESDFIPALNTEFEGMGVIDLGPGIDIDSDINIDSDIDIDSDINIDIDVNDNISDNEKVERTDENKNEEIEVPESLVEDIRKNAVEEENQVEETQAEVIQEKVRQEESQEEVSQEEEIQEEVIQEEVRHDDEIREDESQEGEIQVEETQEEVIQEEVRQEEESQEEEIQEEVTQEEVIQEEVRQEEETREEEEGDGDGDDDEEEEEDDDDDKIENTKKRHFWWLYILIILIALGVLAFIFKDKISPIYQQIRDKITNKTEQVETIDEPEAEISADESSEEEVVEETMPYEPAVLKTTADGKYEYIQFESGHYYAIAGSFPTEADAQRHIRQTGLDQYVPKLVLQEGVTNIRICIGIYDTEAEAESFAKGINPKYWVLK